MNKLVITDIDKEFLTEYFETSNSELADRYDEYVVRETQVEYNSYGVANLKEKDFYKIDSKFFYFNCMWNVLKVEGRMRQKQLIKDGFTFLKIEPDMSIEKLIISLTTEIFHFYNNLDNKFNKRRIIGIALYCYNHPEKNNTKPKNVGIKIDRNVCSKKIDRYSKSNDIGAFNKAKSDCLSEYVIDNYNEEISLEENSKILGLTPRTIQKYLNTCCYTCLTDKQLELKNLMDKYDVTKSIGENAKILGITKSKAQRLKTKLDNR